jgi:hypothetical protein
LDVTETLQWLSFARDSTTILPVREEQWLSAPSGLNCFIRLNQAQFSVQKSVHGALKEVMLA